MKKLLVTILALSLLMVGFLVGRHYRPRAYDIQLTVDAPPVQAASSAELSHEAQANIHALRLQYLGSDDNPGLPPTATELAFFQACVDEEFLSNRREQASLEYEREWGNWRDLGEPSDPILRQAKKASHDLAMLAQADHIKALTKRIAATQALMEERAASQ